MAITGTARMAEITTRWRSKRVGSSRCSRGSAPALAATWGRWAVYPVASTWAMSDAGVTASSKVTLAFSVA